MILLKSDNNWKLYEHEKNKYSIETPNGFSKKINCINVQNALNIFNHAVKFDWTWLEFEVYKISVVKSKQVIKKDTINIKSNRLDQLDREFLTESQANMFLNDIMPEALEKFENCRKELFDLQKRLDFCYSYNIDGDFNGIYNEYSYISFKLKGINFEFKIGD